MNSMDVIDHQTYETCRVLCSNNVIQTGLHFGSKNPGKISIVFEDISRNFVFFRIEVKLYMQRVTNQGLDRFLIPRSQVPETNCRVV